MTVGGPLYKRKKKKEMVDDRFTLLWSFLRYGTHADTAILVGHSHFFRHMVKAHMSSDFKKREPEWTALLEKSKLDNGGCLRVVVEWDTTKGPMEHPVIHSAQLVFGSKLAGGVERSLLQESADSSLGSFSRPSIMSLSRSECDDDGEESNAKHNSINSASKVSTNYATTTDTAETTDMVSF